MMANQLRVQKMFNVINSTYSIIIKNTSDTWF